MFRPGAIPTKGYGGGPYGRTPAPMSHLVTHHQQRPRPKIVSFPSDAASSLTRATSHLCHSLNLKTRVGVELRDWISILVLPAVNDS